MPVPTLSEYAQQYIRERDLAATSEEQILVSVRHFTAHEKRDMPIDEITTDQVNGYLKWLQQNGRADDTIRTRRGNLLVLLNHAFMERLTEFDSRRIRRLKPKRRIVEAWTPDDVKRLFNTSQGWIGRKLANGADEGAFWQAYIATGWDSGLRHSDIIALPMATISERFWWTMKKTGLPVMVDLHLSTVELIERLSRTGAKRDCPLEWPIERRAFFKHAKDLITEAGLTGTLKYLRRGCGTAIAASSQNISDASRKLGHTSQAITVKHYLNPNWQEHPVNLPPEIVRPGAQPSPRKPDAVPTGPKSDIPAIVRPTAETPLEEFLEAYIRGRVFKPSTERQHRETVRKFQSLAGGPMLVSEVNAEKVMKYLTGLEDEGAAPGTIGTRKPIILSIWKEAHALGLNNHPMDALPEFEPKPRTEARWTIEEVQRLHATAMEWESGPREWSLLGLYWATFTAVAWDTGLKREEILVLKRKQIATTMKVYRKDGLCYVHLHPSTVEAVETLAKAQGGQRPPLRRTQKPNGLWKESSKLIKAAGITGNLRYLERDPINGETALLPELAVCEVAR